MNPCLARGDQRGQGEEFPCTIMEITGKLNIYVKESFHGAKWDPVALFPTTQSIESMRWVNSEQVHRRK